MKFALQFQPLSIAQAQVLTLKEETNTPNNICTILPKRRVKVGSISFLIAPESQPASSNHEPPPKIKNKTKGS
jgi:hypothetical protein